MRIWLRSVGTLVLAVLVLWTGIGAARAQSITGEIDGAVTDSQGAVLPNATVTITDTDTNEVARTTTTNSRGEYSAPLLKIGHYTITASAPGFEKTDIVGIQVNVSDTLTFNARLHPGNVAETVTVTGAEEAPNIETAEGSSLITENQMHELALNTRNFEQMVLLQPGVVYTGTDELYPGLINARGAANTSSIQLNGLRQNQLSWTLDGGDILNHGGLAQVAVFPSVDSITQIKVLRNSYGAQYGGGGSAQVIVASKAGGSSFHGDAFEFFRTQYLNANDFQNIIATPEQPRPPETYNNFGYTVGGPLYIPHLYTKSKDNTFFFVSQEFRRITLANPIEEGNFPAVAQANGYFRGPVCIQFKNATGNNCTIVSPLVSNSPYAGFNYQVPMPNMNVVAQEYLKDVIQPSTQLQSLNNPLDPQGIYYSGLSTTHENQIGVRIDHTFTNRLNMFVHYLWDPYHINTPYGLYAQKNYPGVSPAHVDSFGQQVLLHGTFVVTPTMVADFGYSFVHFGVDAHATGFLAKENSPDVQVSLPYISTINRVPSLVINGGTWDEQAPNNTRGHIQQLFENTTKQVGRHTLYFGVNFEHTYAHDNAGQGNAGEFNFTGNANFGGNPNPALSSKFEQAFANFLTGRVNSFTQSSVDAIQNISQTLFETYMQDNWRVLPHLTLNAGVRYSLYGQPYDTTKHLGALDPQKFDPTQTPTFATDGTLCITGLTNPACTTAPNPNYNALNGIINGGINSPYGGALSSRGTLNFAPRVGFAWDVYGDGKTALRGGYGVFYNQTAQTLAVSALNGNPAYVLNSTFNNVTYQAPGGTLSPAIAVPSITGQEPHWTTPYTQEYSLDVQQTLARSWMFDIGYVGSGTFHLAGEEDLNQLLPGQAMLQPGTGAAEAAINYLRPYAGYGPISYYSTRFFSDYNGLQVSTTRSFSKRDLVNLNYTWSRALANSPGASGSAPQNRFDLKPEWGPTNADRRHVFTANIVYDFPFFANQQGWRSKVMGGWEVSTIVQMVSGLWSDVDNTSVDPAGQGNLAPGSDADLRPDQIGNPNIGPRTKAQFFNTAAFAFVPLGDFRPGSAHYNSVEQPGYQTWNIALMRNFHLPHESHLQLRLEGFNAFNHVNFNTAGTNFNNDTNFGTITAYREMRKVQLGAKYTF